MRVPSAKALIVLLLLSTLQGLAAPKKKVKIKTPKKAPKASVSKTSPPPPKEIVVVPPRQSSWAFKGLFGLNRWAGLGFWSGIGVNYIPENQNHLRLGIESSILLVSQGSLSSFLFSAQFMPGRKSFYQQGASLGFLVGPGFSGGGLPKSSTLFVILAEGAWNEKLSEFVQVQLALRAGKIGSEWAFQPGVGLVFFLA